MKTGRVIGNIWATRKADNLSGLKLLVVQPISLLDDSPVDTLLGGANTTGAGTEEKVIFEGGSPAGSPAGSREIPVDATIVGIVDDQEIDESLINGKR